MRFASSSSGADLRARVGLSRLLEVLGPSLLTARFVPAERDDDVFDIVIWDSSDEPSISKGDLVLAVGVHEESEIRELLGVLGSAGATGLVIKLQSSPSSPTSPLAYEAAVDSGVALLQLTSGASWEQLVVLVRTLLVRDEHALDAGTATSAAADDLFGLAEAVSAMLDAPVTIEDRSSRVLAFSGRQGDVDEARRETILGRRVPDRYKQLLEERGIFRRLLSDTAPIYIESLTEGMLPRTAVSVRASHEVLGSIWAATGEPLTEERQEWLTDAANFVALHLLRLRAEADVHERLRSQQLASLLQGGKLSVEAAGRLGLTPGTSCVVACTHRGGDPASAEEDLQRLNTALVVHLSAVRPRSAVARVGDVVYAVISPVEEADRTGRGPVSLMQQFVDYADQGHSFLIGVGRPARAFADLVRSRSDADKALRVLREQPRLRQVAAFVDVHVESLLLRLADLVMDDDGLASGPIESLAAYDRRHHSDFLETLVAYLDAFGDVATASAKVHVHPNTFRYRLRRLSAISGIDLCDPEARFSAMLQFRLRSMVAPDERPALDGTG